LNENASYVAVVVPLIIHALGVALIFTAGTLTAMDAVPEDDTGSASGMLQMSQQVGGSVGIAVAVSVYATGAIEGQFIPGFAGAMFAGAGLAAAATIVAIFTIDKTKSRIAGKSTSGTHV
jgi:MFS family permease